MSPIQPLSIGTSIHQYVVKEQIGIGSFGATYRVQYTAKGGFVKDAALKQLIYEGSDVDDLRKEASVLLNLQHPSIPTVHGFFEHEGYYYLVMDYINGKTLEQVSQERGALTELEALGIVKQLASILTYVHMSQVTHSDIKPANVMLDPHGRLYLVDFGGAKLRLQHRAEEEIAVAPDLMSMRVLTPQYAAPEQKEKKRMAFRSDIFAVGMTAIHLLAGQPPTDNTLSTLKVRKQTRNLLSHCTHPRWEDRPSARELLNGVESILAMGPGAPPKIRVEPQLLEGLPSEAEEQPTSPDLKDKKYSSIFMPDVGTPAKIVCWLKSVGQIVIEGEPLFEIARRLDDRRLQVLSPASGVLSEIIYAAGANVSISALVGVIRKTEHRESYGLREEKSTPPVNAHILPSDIIVYPSKMKLSLVGIGSVVFLILILALHDAPKVIEVAGYFGLPLFSLSLLYSVYRLARPVPCIIVNREGISVFLAFRCRVLHWHEISEFLIYDFGSTQLLEVVPIAGLARAPIVMQNTELPMSTKELHSRIMDYRKKMLQAELD